MSTNAQEEVRFARDSPLEALGVVVVSVLVRADFFVGGESAEAT